MTPDEGVPIAGSISSNGIHVRGIGVDSWDGTEAGVGAYENEQALRTIFEAFGPVEKVTVRHRIENGKNTSWALVNMKTAEGVEGAMHAGTIMAGSNPLELHLFNGELASASTGFMGGQMGNLKKSMDRLGKQDANSAYEVSTEVQRMLDEYDTDHDGQFSKPEVVMIVSHLMHQKKQVNDLKKVACAAFVALIAVCASMFAMAVLGAEVAKDQAQDDGGVMTVKGTDIVVQVASSELTVAPDGSLVPRGSLNDDGERRMLAEGDPAPLLAIRTAAAMEEHTLTSTLPDSAFRELRTLDLTSDTGNFATMRVDAAVRYPKEGSRCGTIVVLFTHLGEITLDGEDMYFEESIAGSLTNAGFPKAAFSITNFGGRRLNVALMVIGLFNAINQIIEDRCELNANNVANYNGLRDGPLPKVPKGSFTLDMMKYEECDTRTDEGMVWCAQQPGVAPHPADFPGKVFWSTHITLALQGDVSYSRKELSWEDRVMHYRQKGNVTWNWESNGHELTNCVETADTPGPVFDFGDNATYNGDGFVVQGRRARKFTFYFEDAKTQIPMYAELYDSGETGELLRLNFNAIEDDEFREKADRFTNNLDDDEGDDTGSGFHADPVQQSGLVTCSDVMHWTDLQDSNDVVCEDDHACEKPYLEFDNCVGYMERSGASMYEQEQIKPLMGDPPRPISQSDYPPSEQGPDHAEVVHNADAATLQHMYGGNLSQELLQIIDETRRPTFSECTTWARSDIFTKDSSMLIPQNHSRGVHVSELRAREDCAAHPDCTGFSHCESTGLLYLYRTEFACDDGANATVWVDDSTTGFKTFVNNNFYDQTTGAGRRQLQFSIPAREHSANFPSAAKPVFFFTLKESISTSGKLEAGSITELSAGINAPALKFGPATLQFSGTLNHKVTPSPRGDSHSYQTFGCLGLSIGIDAIGSMAITNCIGHTRKNEANECGGLWSVDYLNIWREYVIGECFWGCAKFKMQMDISLSYHSSKSMCGGGYVRGPTGKAECGNDAQMYPEVCLEGAFGAFSACYTPFSVGVNLPGVCPKSCHVPCCSACGPRGCSQCKTAC